MTSNHHMCCLNLLILTVFQFETMLGKPMHLLPYPRQESGGGHLYCSDTKSIQKIALCCCTDATSTALQTSPHQIHISSPPSPKPFPSMNCTPLHSLPDASRTNTFLGPQARHHGHIGLWRRLSWLSRCFRGCSTSPAGSCASYAFGSWINLEIPIFW